MGLSIKKEVVSSSSSSSYDNDQTGRMESSTFDSTKNVTILKSFPPSFYLVLRGEEVQQPTEPILKPMKIVLLHGFSQCHTCWLTTAHQLRNRYGHSILLLDFYGHGRSPPLKNYKDCDAITFMYQVRSIIEIIGWSNEALCFAGISLGGAVAQHYLVSYPQNVDRIMLIATAGFSEDTYFSLANYTSRIVQILLKTIDLTNKVFDVKWIIQTKQINKVLNNLNVVKDTPAYSVPQEERSMALRRIPVTVIVARLDFVHPPQVRRIRDANDQTTFMILPWMDHLIICSSIDCLKLHRFGHFWHDLQEQETPRSRL